MLLSLFLLIINIYDGTNTLRVCVCLSFNAFDIYLNFSFTFHVCLCCSFQFHNNNKCQFYLKSVENIFGNLKRHIYFSLDVSVSVLFVRANYTVFMLVSPCGPLFSLGFYYMYILCLFRWWFLFVFFFCYASQC